MTVDPPARVAVTLGLLRGVADEIIVAVDSRIDPVELDAYAGVADRVVRFESRGPVDRPRTWLHAQCSGEWTFYLDGDEVPSAALVVALRQVLDADDVVHYWIPRRWLFGGPRTWLRELPWSPDFQLRLARRGSALGFRGGVHGGLAPLLPARHLDAPIYHLDFLLSSESAREAKAAAYERIAPGPAAYGGGRLNETLYLPERHASGLVRPVPPEDLRFIERVLDASPHPPKVSTGVGTVRHVDAPLIASERIDALAPGTALPAASYRTHLSLFEDEERRFFPGETRPMYVRVRNLGTVWWPWGSEQEPALRLTYRWWSVTGELVVDSGVRTPLTARLGPGADQLLPMWVTAPREPGSYRLEIELVHEGVRRFESPAVIPIVVGNKPITN